MHPHHRSRLVDIAKRIGCSHAAVARVLTGAGEGSIRVGQKRADAIRRVAAELNFRPNHAAQQLKGKRAMTLGMISASWESPFQLRTLYWIQRLAAEQGYQTLVAHSVTLDDLRHAIDQFCSRGVDDALLFSRGAPPLDDSAAELLAQLPGLVALFGRPAVPGLSYVDVDEADGVRQAVEHLQQRGRRRIALLVTDDRAVSDPLRRGFLAAHRALGRSNGTKPICLKIRRWDWSMPDVHQQVDAAIERLVVGRGVDAVIAYDDYAAAFLLQGLARRGLRVPDDVAVVGFENDLISHHLSPPLTTVHVPVREPVEAAIGMLIDAVERSDSRLLRSQTFQPRLMIRGTS